MSALPFPPFALTATFACAAAVNLALALALATGRTAPAVGLALLPVVIIIVGALVAHDPSILVLAGLALPLMELPATTAALPGTGGSIFPADVLVVLAVGAWTARWLISSPESRPKLPPTPLIGWPLLLFAVIAFIATLRGHYAYDTSLLGQALRLALFAGIAAAMTRMDARKFYRGLVVLLYAGTVYWSIEAAYRIVTHTSATSTEVLSTGGIRWLSGGTSMYMAGALVLALLNLRLDPHARRRGIHLAVALLAVFCIIAAFGRATFVALALALPLLLIATRGIGSSVATILPLFAPIVVLLAIFVPRAVPDLLPTLQHRVLATDASDENVRWREGATSAVWRQVEESPIWGVGFGRGASFTIEERNYRITQDPHNSFLYLWAGGGTIAFVSFLLLLATFVVHAYRRIRRTTRINQALVIWAFATWSVFMINTLAGPILTQPQYVLTVWILMLIPAVVPVDAAKVRLRPGYRSVNTARQAVPALNARG